MTFQADNQQRLSQFVEMHGPIADAWDVPEERILPRVGLVPDLLVEMWRTYGVGGFRDRGFWFVMPGMLDGVAAEIFGGDPDLGRDTQIIAYGAMGNFLCWNPDHGILLVSPGGGSMQAPGLMNPPKSRDPDVELFDFLMNFHEFFLDRVDDDNQPMLARAKERLGPLSNGLVYAIYPARRLPGARIEIDNVQIDDVRIYLSEAALGISFMLQDYVGNRSNIRTVGGQ